MPGYQILDGAVVRSTDVSSSLLYSTLGQDAITTELVLGMPQGAFPGRRILGTVTTLKQHFRYPVFNAEHLVVKDTERGLKEPIGTSGIKAAYNSAFLKRHTHACDFDDDELSENMGDSIGSILNMQQRGTWNARQTVELNLESLRHDLLTTVTNYPAANRLALGVGSEFNGANGDARANIKAMAAQITAGTPYSRRDLSVFMAYDAYEAALEDPTFLAVRGNYTHVDGDEAVLAQYYGVREVWYENPVVSTDGTTDTLADLYSDLAIVYLAPEVTAPNGLALPELTAGVPRFGAAFTMNDGVALRPYRKDDHTTWYFPWQQREFAAITWSKFGAIITNATNAA